MKSLGYVINCGLYGGCVIRDAITHGTEVFVIQTV